MAEGAAPLSVIQGSVPERLLYTADDVLQLLPIGRTTYYELLASGELESVRIGRKRYVPAEALEAYVQRLRDEQGRRR